MNAEPTEDTEDHGLIRDRQRLTSRLNVVVNKFAANDDLLLSCLWRDMLPGEAPAWYDPAHGHITVNAHMALGAAHPRDVNPLTWAGRRKHPEIIGLLAHEASHAHSTATSQEAHDFKIALHRESPLLLEVFTLLEEPRIEYRQISRRPHDRYYLRAQSVLIDLAPFTFASDSSEMGLDRWKAATAALLVFGRVDAGILNGFDADPVRGPLVDALGYEDLKSLRSVQRRAIAVADDDLESLAECARAWLEVVGPPESDDSLDELLDLLADLAPFGCGGGTAGSSGVRGEPGDADRDDDGDEWANSPEDEAAEAGEPRQGEGVSSADDEDGDSPSDDAQGQEAGEVDGQGLRVLTGVGEGLKQMASAVTADVAAESALVDAESASHAAGQASAKDRAKQSKQKLSDERKATTVFDGPPARSSGRVLGDLRAPTGAERRLAREVGLALKKAQFRDRVATKHSSMAPPGRLNGRDAMLGQAQKSMGNMVTARPFKSKRTRHAPEPPVAFGAMGDISGSMKWAEGALASTAWVLANSMRHVTGVGASVLFGQHAIPLTGPGELPGQVQEFVANGAHENFGAGFAALNGALGLTSGVGVRVLVVVSDGQYYRQADARARDEVLARLKRSGAHVLWVGLEGSNFPEDATSVVVPREEVASVLAQALGTSIGESGLEVEPAGEWLTGVIVRSLTEALRSAGTR